MTFISFFAKMLEFNGPSKLHLYSSGTRCQQNSTRHQLACTNQISMHDFNSCVNSTSQQLLSSRSLPFCTRDCTLKKMSCARHATQRGGRGPVYTASCASLAPMISPRPLLSIWIDRHRKSGTLLLKSMRPSRCNILFCQIKIRAKKTLNCWKTKCGT